MSPLNAYAALSAHSYFYSRWFTLLLALVATTSAARDVQLHASRGASPIPATALGALLQPDLSVLYFPDPEAQPGWTLYGGKSLRIARFEEALPALETYTQEHPSDALGWLRLGFVLQALGRLHDAASCYEQSLQISPSDANAWHALATTYRRLDDNDATTRAYARAVNLAPGKLAVWRDLGSWHLSKRRYAQARSAYQRVLRSRPSDVPALSGLATTALLAKRNVEALHTWRQITKLEPGNIAAWHNLGILHALRGERGEVAAIRARLNALHPPAARNFAAQTGSLVADVAATGERRFDATAAQSRQPKQRP